MKLIKNSIVKVLDFGFFYNNNFRCTKNKNKTKIIIVI